MIRFLRERVSWFTTRQLLIALVVSLTLLLTIWTFALWYIDARLAYRNDNDSGLAALYLAPEVGKGVGAAIAGALFGRRRVGSFNVLVIQDNAIQAIDGILITLDQAKLELDNWIRTST